MYSRNCILILRLLALVILFSVRDADAVKCALQNKGELSETGPCFCKEVPSAGTPWSPRGSRTAPNPTKAFINFRNVGGEIVSKINWIVRTGDLADVDGFYLEIGVIRHSTGHVMQRRRVLLGKRGTAPPFSGN